MKSQFCIELCKNGSVWDLALPPGEKLVLLAWVETGEAAPGVEKIAALTGYSERRVRSLLAALVEKAILVERRRPGKKTQYTSALTPGPSPSRRGQEKISWATSLQPPGCSDKGLKPLVQGEGKEEIAGVEGGKDDTPEMAARARVHAGARDSVVGLNRFQRFQIEINNNNSGEEGIDEPAAAREGRECAQDGEALTPETPPPDSLPAAQRGGTGRGEMQEIVQVRGMAGTTALDLIGRYGVARVLSVARYANDCRALSNPAGFVVAKLQTGWEPPEQRAGEPRGGSSLTDGKRYTTGKYAAFIRH